MTKIEFIELLRVKLSGLPAQEVDERLDFYSEMIDDRIEEGKSEEEAIVELGSVDEVAEQIIAEIPLTSIAKERIRPKKRLGAWEIVLLVLGSPIWLSLAIAAFAVILSLYVVLWSVIVSLWACFGALVGCAVGGVAAGAVFAALGNVPSGIATIGAGSACAGLSILFFLGCKEATRGNIWLTKRLALGIKKLFVKKEES